ncbi:hypothetical protein J4Q44_G00023290 [Coregonus suidteri]|uniref:Uncharacterized protein n=1 Tax=Coregonus suidteri TaxID=861788 RepID=A0AAN8MBP2_9TELE
MLKSCLFNVKCAVHDLVPYLLPNQTKHSSLSTPKPNQTFQSIYSQTNHRVVMYKHRGRNSMCNAILQFQRPSRSTLSIHLVFPLYSYESIGSYDVNVGLSLKFNFLTCILLLYTLHMIIMHNES